jgi:hypothetical protein
MNISGGAVVTIGSLLEGGFRIVKERGGALLIWTFILLLATIASAYASGWAERGRMDAIAAGVPVDAADASNALQGMLIGLIGLFAGTIVVAAVQRSILRPTEGGLAWLKLGADELRLFALLMLYLIIFILAFVVFGVFAGGLVGANQQALMILLFVPALAGIIFFGTKLSLTFPLTLKRGAFAMRDGWALTTGHFWTLFAVNFIIVVALTAATCLAVLVSEPEYVAAISQYGFLSSESADATMRPYLRLIDGTIDAPMIINFVLLAILSAVNYALLGGAAATAVLELDGAEEGLSETFS